MSFQLIVLWCFNIISSSALNLGGIFENDRELEDAFRCGIDRINAVQENIVFHPIITNVSAQNPYEAMNLACALFESGTVAIFGPYSKDNINAIQSACDAKEVPHILIKPIYRPLRTGTIVNLYPHPPVLSRACVDIITSLEWKMFTILYEDDDSLIRVSDLMHMTTKVNVAVTIKQLDKFRNGDYRAALKEIRDSGQKYFLIDCQIRNLLKVLEQIQQMGLMTRDYNYFITNLDTHTLDLSIFQYSLVNMTGIRLINTNSELVKQVAETLYENEEDQLIAWKLKTEMALIIDGLSLFYTALKDIDNVKSMTLSCNSGNSWPLGYSLVSSMKTSAFEGVSGMVRFDNEGFRSDFNLEVYELKEEGGISKIGNWNSTGGLNLTRLSHQREEDDPDSLRNKTFIVITTLTEPFGMLKESVEHRMGNDRFEGFAIDLIHELSLMEGFNYTFIIRHDKKNGARDSTTGKWSGMLGDVIEHRADLAITDLTITSEREAGVDFTSPFMNMGISILFKKPKKAPPSFFSFADPFALDTWIGLGIAYTVVSISLFIMGRLCPGEWTNPYPCIQEPEFFVNQFSFFNSFWFTIGSLMQQGTEIAPIAIATRLVAGMWWFFVLILVSSYTANLAAFLSNENPIELFSDVFSMVENAAKHKIRYGAKAGGSTVFFFRDSAVPAYRTIYQHMLDHPEDMVKESDDGVKLAIKEDYAFFMESSSIEYQTQRHCDLQQYGKLLDDKGYGIAMRKDSSYRKRLSTAVLKLQSSGKIASLKRKWWEERRGGGTCTGETEGAEATPLSLKNVGGAFYVTVFGIVSASILVCIEMAYNIVKVKRKARITLKEAAACEFKAYLNFESNVKPVVKSKSRSKSKLSLTESPKDSDQSHSHGTNNNSNPRNQTETADPVQYGFVVPSIRERLTTNS